MALITDIAGSTHPHRPYGMVEFRAMASPCRIVTDDDEMALAGECIVRELE